VEPEQPAAELVESVGSIQLLCLGFDGNHFRGEILPELERLKQEGIVRVIDLLFVRKDSLGNVMVTTGTDLDWEEAVSLGSYLGALTGLAEGGPTAMERGAIAGAAELADGHFFDDGDVFRVTQALPEDMSAALVIMEHLWSKPLLDAVDRAGGVELSNVWLRPENVFSAARLRDTPNHHSELGES